MARLDFLILSESTIFGNFACGEDIHALRLASELADLRAGYSYPCAWQSHAPCSIYETASKKEQSTKCSVLFLSPFRIANMVHRVTRRRAWVSLP